MQDLLLGAAQPKTPQMACSGGRLEAEALAAAAGFPCRHQAIPFKRKSRLLQDGL